MGYITLEYSCSDITNLNTIIKELEYGNTFAIYKDREVVIGLPGEKYNWVTIQSKNKNSFSLSVVDEFFEEESFFEKILTAFVFNLIDFGHIRFENIKIDQSSLKFREVVLDNNLSKTIPTLGTIFKPYYHFPIEEKMQFASKIVSVGMNIIKEDETYIVEKGKILEEAKKIQTEMGENAFYVPNITPHLNDHDFVLALYNSGIRIFMVNFLITGFGPIKQLKNKLPQIKLWGHRVGYSAIENIISVEAVTQLAVLSGIDLIHIGTTIKNEELLKQKQLIEDMCFLNPNFFPIFSKTTAEIIPKLVSILGPKLILMACGYF